jgi:hypothetical protein
MMSASFERLQKRVERKLDMAHQLLSPEGQ